MIQDMLFGAIGGLGLFLFVRNSPLWTSASFLRLEAAARAAMPALHRAGSLESLPPERLQTILARVADEQEVRVLLHHCDTILVLEELEPHLERGVYVEAHRLGFEGRIFGKLDGTFSRIIEYGV